MKTHHHNYLSVRSTIQTLAAEKMYYGSKLLHKETTQNELIAITYLLPEET